MKKVTVNVTQEMINGKHFCDSRKCMVALGIQAALGIPLASVTNDSFRITDNYPERDKYYPLPEFVTRKIAAFDSGLSVSPFSFEISVPD